MTLSRRDWNLRDVGLDSMRRGTVWIRILLCGVVVLAVRSALRAADEPTDAAGNGSKSEIPLKRNLTSKTLGGRQFWGDVRCFHGWRIQQNVFTGHYRLLDEKDFRQASGSLTDCEAVLQQLTQERKLPPMTGKAVVLVHGIFRSSKSMAPLREPFEKAGYSVFAIDYPSTQGTIQESAEFLSRVIESLDGISEINFVVHSMGGLVVRTYLQQAKTPDPRIARMVMIGSPNTGAHLADLLQDKANALFRPLYGPAGQQLGTDPEGFIAKLPVPSFEFAVVAGGRSNEAGYNPLIPGDDDGVVSVESTRLPGASDFLLVPSAHTFLCRTPEVVEAAVRFVSAGQLRAEGEKSPIPRAAAAPRVLQLNGAGS